MSPVAGLTEINSIASVRAAGVRVFHRSKKKSATVSRLSRVRMRQAAVWIAGGSARVMSEATTSFFSSQGRCATRARAATRASVEALRSSAI